MQCTNCGATLKEGAAFCENCGQPVATVNTNLQDSDTTRSLYGNDPQTQYNQPYQSNPPPRPYQPAPPSPYMNAAPTYNTYTDESVMTTGSWFVTMLITAIPIVGIVMIFIWAFGSSGNINRRNYARAVLIWALIAIVLGILFSVVFAGFWASFMREFGDEFGSNFTGFAGFLPFFR